MPLSPSLLESAGGAGGAAGALGGLASATPYGALAGAAGQVLSSALQDTPTSVTSGSGSYQSGPFVIGSKQVGGKGNSGGTTTASASQTPAGESPGDSATKNNTMIYVIIGAVVVLILGGISIFAFRRKK